MIFEPIKPIVSNTVLEKGFYYTYQEAYFNGQRIDKRCSNLHYGIIDTFVDEYKATNKEELILLKKLGHSTEITIDKGLFSDKDIVYISPDYGRSKKIKDKDSFVYEYKCYSKRAENITLRDLNELPIEEYVNWCKDTTKLSI